jgi:hypothetical protein
MTYVLIPVVWLAIAVGGAIVGCVIDWMLRTRKRAFAFHCALAATCVLAAAMVADKLIPGGIRTIGLLALGAVFELGSWVMTVLPWVIGACVAVWVLQSIIETAVRRAIQRAPKIDGDGV